MAFKQAPELERAEVHGPDAVIDFFQAHVRPRADGGDIDPVVVPANAAVGTDVPDLEAIGVLQQGESLGHRAWRGRIGGRGRLQIQGFVRPFGVELLAEAIEAPLLSGEAPRRRARGLGLQGAMHAFMAAILLRLARFDQLGQNAQADPPGGEARESGQRVGGKGHAIVGADALGEPELVKQPREHRFGLVYRGRVQRLAAQQIAAEAIGDGQGIAVPAVAGFELAFEVGAPGVIGREDLRGGFAGMADVPAVPGGGDQAVATEDVTHGRPAGPGPARGALLQQREELLGAPGGVPTAGVENRGDEILRGLVGGHPGLPRTLFQARGPVPQIAVDPLVAGLATHPVEGAELGHRQCLA